MYILSIHVLVHVEKRYRTIGLVTHVNNVPPEFLIALIALFRSLISSKLKKALKFDTLRPRLLDGNQVCIMPKTGSKERE